MPELKFKQLVIFAYSGTTADFKIGDQEVKVQLTEAEEHEIRAVAFRAFERNRAELARAINEAQPALLMPPESVTAEWDEVTDTSY